MGGGQSFIVVIAQFLLIWFESRLVTGIIGIQAERLLPNWGSQDTSKDRKQVTNSPHPLLRCRGGESEAQRQGNSRDLVPGSQLKW